MAEAVRPSAFETDDGALRCYLDQLPPDRCVFCATPTPARLLRVAGPVHTTSTYEDLADGGTGGRLLAGAALLAGSRSVIQGQTMQTKGRAWLAVCPKCTPKPWVPAVLAVVLFASTTGYLALHGTGAILQTIVGYILAMGCVWLAIQRLTLRVGEIDEDDHMFKLRGVASEIATEVLALGPRPHPRHQPRQQQLHS